MDTVRKVWPVVVGAWLAAWVARALFDWILGVEDAERRDTALGWTAFVGGVTAVAITLVVLRRT